MTATDTRSKRSSVTSASAWLRSQQRGARRGARSAGPRRHPADRTDGRRSVRRDGGKQESRPGRALSAEGGPRRLHDRIRGPRVKRRDRSGAQAHRSSAPPLPIGRLLLRAGAAGSGSTPLRDILLGLVAAADEPISGGRHKVFGNHALAVIPQTSTIASYAPCDGGRVRDRTRAADRCQPCVAGDAIVVCSFGDASLNHSTALGALNAAEYNVHRGCGCRCCSAARTTASASASARPAIG